MSDAAATLALAEQLIARESVTPRDGGCQALIAERLERIGFECRTLAFGPAEARVDNLWACRRGRAAGGPLFAFAGHSDVVPAGPASQWHSDPFQPSRRDGRLYGRGAADMKTSLAAMVVAAEEFVAATPEHGGAIAFIVTSDEEGPAVDGTVRVCNWLSEQGIAVDFCVVGEPTSVSRLGDTIKNGRRGSMSGRLTVRGVQGHIAYPHLARNPIHLAMPALAELAATDWDRGNAHFPPTSWQVSNIHAGTGAGNVIPGELTVDFNFRFSTEATVASLQQRVQAVLDRHGVPSEIGWTLSGEPFLTPPGDLSGALTRAIHSVTGVATELSTTGGTSDGRFIAKLCQQVVEFGPVNASIHQIDEHVAIDDIEPLKTIYRKTLEALLT